MKRLALFAVALIAIASSLRCAGASEGTNGLGESCDADEDCEAGLSCVDGGELVDENGAPACVEARFCTQSCETDDDCAAVADGTICIDACDIVSADARGGVGGPVCFEGSRG